MSAIPAELAPTERPSMWRNRTFVSIWLGRTISCVGDGFHNVALGLWVLQTTGSAMAMASIMMVRILASIFLGAIAGTVVDRVDRRRLMITTNVARFFLVGAIAYLVATPGAPFYLIITLSGLMAICGLFHGPAFQASLVNIVGKDHLPKAMGLVQMSETVALIIGPSLGGAIVALYGGWMALSGDAVSFLVAAVLVLIGGTFASPRKEGEGKVSFWKDMQEGFAYIRQHPFVKSIVIMGPALNFFGYALGLVFPVIAIKVWMANSYQFGVLEAAIPLGFTIGAGLIMALGKKLKNRGWWILGSQVVTGLLAVIVFSRPTVGMALPIIPLIGLALAMCNVLLTVALQAEVPTAVQGRVFGTMTSLMNIASPLAMMVTGILADLYRPNLVGVGLGIGLAVVAAIITAVAPAIRRYN
jgi:DHA3 family macrolide efflux protein-like MFS transporter